VSSFDPVAIQTEGSERLDTNNDLSSEINLFLLISTFRHNCIEHSVIILLYILYAV